MSAEKAEALVGQWAGRLRADQFPVVGARLLHGKIHRIESAKTLYGVAKVFTNCGRLLSYQSAKGTFQPATPVEIDRYGCKPCKP